MARKKKVVQNLLITGIADKGNCVGRSDEGEVIFLEGGVPGDIVDVLVYRKKKKVAQGIVTEIKKYSENRVDPVCDHFGVCGGCKWQNLNYETQLLHKQKNVVDSITRIAKLDASIVKPIIGSESIVGYRNKLEYSFSSKRWITKEEVESDIVINQQGALGFHRPGAFDKIVDIEACHLQDDLTNQIRNAVRQFGHNHNVAFYDIRNQKGLLRNMIIRNTSLGDWMVLVVFGHKDPIIPQLMDMLMDTFPQINSLNYTINGKVNDTIYDCKIRTVKGKPYIIEQLGDIQYLIGPKSFFQTNPKQAKVLFDVAVSLAELNEGDNVYDLYTGLGSIALYIAKKVKHVVGIEEVKEAIEDANANKEYNHIDNATFYAGDVKDILTEEFIVLHGKPDIVITDPPRAGMHPDVVQTLLTLAAPRIVYISCNPATQARDLAILDEKYDVLSIQPVDMFPHTNHIESVAQLKLKVHG